MQGSSGIFKLVLAVRDSELRQLLALSYSDKHELHSRVQVHFKFRYNSALLGSGVLPRLLLIFLTSAKLFLNFIEFITKL